MVSTLVNKLNWRSPWNKFCPELLVGSVELFVRRCEIKENIYPFAKCRVCREIGHIFRGCPKLLERKRNQAKADGTVGAKTVPAGEAKAPATGDKEIAETISESTLPSTEQQPDPERKKKKNKKAKLETPAVATAEPEAEVKAPEESEKKKKKKKLQVDVVVHEEVPTVEHTEPSKKKKKNAVLEKTPVEAEVEVPKKEKKKKNIKEEPLFAEEAPVPEEPTKKKKRKALQEQTLEETPMEAEVEAPKKEKKKTIKGEPVAAEETTVLEEPSKRKKKVNSSLWDEKKNVISLLNSLTDYNCIAFDGVRFGLKVKVKAEPVDETPAAPAESKKKKKHWIESCVVSSRSRCLSTCSDLEIHTPVKTVQHNPLSRIRVSLVECLAMNSAAPDWRSETALLKSA